MPKLYPDDENGHLDLLGALSYLHLFEQAAVVVEWCSEGPRLGEDILVCLNHLRSEASCVPLQALGYKGSFVTKEE